MSRLPPHCVGGSTEYCPGCRGATPIVPGNGANGSVTLWLNLTFSLAPSTSLMFSQGSGNSSASSPKPGMIAVQPQSLACMPCSCTSSVSPGRAPLTYTGPVTGLTFAMSIFGTSSWVDVGVSCPPEASAVSSSTVAPDSTSSTGSIALSQTVWRCWAAMLCSECAWRSAKPAKLPVMPVRIQRWTALGQARMLRGFRRCGDSARR